MLKLYKLYVIILIGYNEEDWYGIFNHVSIEKSTQRQQHFPSLYLNAELIEIHKV